MNRNRESLTTRRDASKPNLTLIFVVIAAFLFGGMLISQRFISTPKTEETQIDLAPVLISVREIGKLHSATMNFKDAMKFTSDRHASGWFKDIPGAEDVAKWATHNEVLLIAQGSVEAGVDLSKLDDAAVTKLKQPDGTTRIEVQLPPIEIYPAEVKVHVENNQSGLLWKDDNIVPKAQAEAGKRFREAAEKEHITNKAQESVLTTLEHLQQTAGWKNVTFKF